MKKAEGGSSTRLLLFLQEDFYKKPDLILHISEYLQLRFKHQPV